MQRAVITFIVTLSLLTGCSCRANYQAAIQAYDLGEDEEAMQLFAADSQSYQAKVYLVKLSMQVDPDLAEEWIIQAIQQSPNEPDYFVKGRVMGAQELKKSSATCPYRN